MSDRKFIKMHGLGNDFVVLDRRANGDAVSPALARAVADRNTGIGCDQVIVIGKSETGLADAELVFFNPDGGTSAACGNGTRCVASLLMGETGAKHLVLETGHGLLDADCSSNGEICILCQCQRGDAGAGACGGRSQYRHRLRPGDRHW